MFRQPANVGSMIICPLHRSELGLGWIKGTMQGAECQHCYPITVKRAQHGRNATEESGKVILRSY